MERLSEDQYRQQMPMAYFLHKAANDTTNRKTISRMLEVHGSHLGPDHVEAVKSLDKDRVTHFLTNECAQFADISGIANGMIFLADEPSSPGGGPDDPSIA